MGVDYKSLIDGVFSSGEDGQVLAMNEISQALNDQPTHTPGTPQNEVGMLDSGTQPTFTVTNSTKWPLPIITDPNKYSYDSRFPKDALLKVMERQNERC